MPDITCCTNRTCELRSHCYRYLTTWSERQSLACFTGGADCEHFIPYGGTHEKRAAAADARIDKLHEQEGT